MCTAVVKPGFRTHKEAIGSGLMADMAEISRPELCIIGAGALGIALAQHARRLGASVVLVDRGVPEGGDGPQQALRLAALAASASAAAIMRSGGRLGLAAVDPKVSVKAIQDRARHVAADRAPADSHERLAALGIEIVSGKTRFRDPATLEVGQDQVRAQAYVIAVGAAIHVPDLPGLEEAGYFTPESLLDNSRKLTHLLVIGGGGEALALAQVYARLGSEVTVVPQGDALAGFDIESTSILLQALGEDGVRILDGAMLRDIQPRSQGIGATVQLAGGEFETLDLSHVLVASGRSADLTSLDPDAARLRPVRGKAGLYATDASGRTSNHKIRLAGAAAGIGQWQNALSHGRSVIESLVLGASRRRSGLQPILVQTDPPLAKVGRLPAEGVKLSAGHALIRVNLAENDVVRATGATAGLLKVLVGPRGQVLGASIVGAGAGEMAGVLALAIEQGVTLEALADLPLPNPSLMSSLVALGENRIGVQTVSAFARRRGEIMRRLRI